MQRIECPVCKQQGVLQWKDTVTRIKGKEYHYKKLYVYHQHPEEHPEKPKWCYLNRDHLKALGITQNKDSLTQDNIKSEKPKSSSFYRNNSKYCVPRWPSLVGHRLGKAAVAGSNPARGSNYLRSNDWNFEGWERSHVDVELLSEILN